MTARRSATMALLLLNVALPSTASADDIADRFRDIDCAELTEYELVGMEFRPGTKSFGVPHRQWSPAAFELLRRRINECGRTGPGFAESWVKRRGELTQTTIERLEEEERAKRSFEMSWQDRISAIVDAETTTHHKLFELDYLDTELQGAQGRIRHHEFQALMTLIGRERRALVEQQRVELDAERRAEDAAQPEDQRSAEPGVQKRQRPRSPADWTEDDWNSLRDDQFAAAREEEEREIRAREEAFRRQQEERAAAERMQADVKANAAASAELTPEQRTQRLLDRFRSPETVVAYTEALETQLAPMAEAHADEIAAIGFPDVFLDMPLRLDLKRRFEFITFRSFLAVLAEMASRPGQNGMQLVVTGIEMDDTIGVSVETIGLYSIQLLFRPEAGAMVPAWLGANGTELLPVVSPDAKQGFTMMILPWIEGVSAISPGRELVEALDG